MKKSLLALLVAAPLAFSLTGCVIAVGGEGKYDISSDFEDREHDNRKKIADITLGASLADVQHKFGVADFSESYKNDDKEVRVLYFRTQRKHKDGITTKDETTYLHFVNGELKETGNGADYSRNVGH